MNLKKYLSIAALLVCSTSFAFGDLSEEKKQKFKQKKELCEKHLKKICGDEIEFPDMDNGSPGFSMFKKIKRIKKCIKSEEVQKADIPAECKKNFGPDSE